MRLPISEAEETNVEAGGAEHRGAEAWALSNPLGGWGITFIKKQAKIQQYIFITHVSK